MDCCHRIIPFLEEFEIECRNGDATSGILVVAHQAILRCIFGYLLKSKMEEVPFIKIPQHTIMQVTWLPKCDIGGKIKSTLPDITEEESQNQPFTYVDEVCCVEYVRMPIEHAEQGVIHLPE